MQSNPTPFSESCPTKDVSGDTTNEAMQAIGTRSGKVGTTGDVWAEREIEKLAVRVRSRTVVA